MIIRYKFLAFAIKRAAMVVTLFSLQPSLVRAQTVVQIQYEFPYGTTGMLEAGVTSTHSLSNLIIDQANSLISIKANTVLARVANVAILQLFLGKELYVVIPHEYFGHVNRLNEFGLTCNGFHLRFPGLGGSTNWHLTHAVPAIQRLLVAAAGPEVNSLMAYTAYKDLLTNAYTGTQVGNTIFLNKLGNLIYYKTDLAPFFNNPNSYVSKLRSSGNSALGDFASYAFTLAENYGYYDNVIPKDSLWMYLPKNGSLLDNPFIRDQNQRINKAIIVSLLDLSLFSFFVNNYNYIARGERFAKPFLIGLNKLKLMPSIRFNLGELGAENYFDLFCVLPSGKWMSAYYRHGGNLLHEVNGGGLSLEVGKIKNLNVVASVDYWNNQRAATGNFNASARSTLAVGNAARIIGALGYKSQGALMGKPYSQGFYGSLGLVLRLNYRINPK